MNRLLSALSLLTLLALPVLSNAQTAAVPPMMNFQGRLTKPDGTPVADGTYSLRFSLWTAQSGGTEKWNQTLNPVNVSHGVFGVLLNVANLPTLFDGNLYLEIKIGNNTPLTPRQPLVSVAYAMKANTVPDGSITDAKIVNVDWSKITGAPSSPLALPFVGSTNSPNPAFKITNTGSGEGIFSRATSGYGGYFTSDASFASLCAVGGAFNGLYAETTDAFGNGVKGAAYGGVNAVGVYGTTSDGTGILGEAINGTGIIGYSTGGNAVYGNSNTGSGGYFTSSNGPASLYATGSAVTGMYAESTAGLGRGIQGIAENGQAYSSYDDPHAIGVYGKTKRGIGVEGVSDYTGVRGKGYVGVYGSGKGYYAYGIYGRADADSGFGGDGVCVGTYGYSTARNGAGVLGECAFSEGWGVLSYGKAAGTTGWGSVSDARYKTNVHTFANGLDAILRLRGVTFDWKCDEFKEMHFSKDKQIGFIAQEIEKVLPELVMTDGKGYKSVIYANVVPVLVEAVKQQQTQIDTLNKDADALHRENAQLRASHAAIETQLAQLAQAVQELKSQTKPAHP